MTKEEFDRLVKGNCEDLKRPKKMSDFDYKDKHMFGFGYYDQWEDFDAIAEIIEKRLQPEDIWYYGATSMHGYFIKDGIRVGLEHDGMTGNDWTMPVDTPAPVLEKVRGWAKIVWDALVAGEGRSIDWSKWGPQKKTP